MKFLTTVFLISLLSLSPSFGQTNFRKAMEASNPIDDKSELPLSKKLEIHQAFLEKALQEKNQLQQIHGNIYLFYDHLGAENYPEATRYLLEAEGIAERSGNPSWQGWISFRWGVLYLRIGEEDKAMATYQKAVPLCTEAGDSLCLGESWEQLSALNGLNGDYAEAHRYFNLALPLLKKYGEEKNVGTALNNYGSLLSQQGKHEEAIPIMEEAITLNHKLGRFNAEAKGMNNLANAYRRINRLDKSIEIFNQCIQLNKEQDFQQNMIRNYMGLYLVNEAKGDFKKANDFLIKRFLLRDSLVGIETHEKINLLTKNYENEKIETELQKNKIKLVETQRSLERGGVLLFLLLSSIVLGIWLWRKQLRNKAKELKENQENLKRITRILLEKNTLIKTLEEEKIALENNRGTGKTEEGFSENIYAQRILTKTDWLDFKTLFEKSYPNYLTKIRTHHPEISESEERLFLFLKLKLNRNETAVILGISEDSVKKTRNRLRKRLGLELGVSLEDYVLGF